MFLKNLTLSMDRVICSASIKDDGFQLLKRFYIIGRRVYFDLTAYTVGG